MTVAVAVALYNGEKFILDQMETLRNQTRTPERVVFCDDGSRDQTVNIVLDYIRKYNLSDTWEVHRNAINVGYIKNFYNAMLHCKEDIIFLCDQDDIWKLDKIEKMSRIMEQREDIDLLSSKYDIIDAEGNTIKSIMHKKASETGEMSIVTIRDIMSAYRWPGMVMCVRKEFFDRYYKEIVDVSAPHDLIFAILAADKKAFYEIDYVGAFHRRHQNNTAKEEHRVSKMLDFERKLSDIEVTCDYYAQMNKDEFPVSANSKKYIEYKWKHLIRRKTELERRSLLGIINLYISDEYKVLRLASFIGDVWLVVFGKNRR